MPIASSPASRRVAPTHRSVAFLFVAALIAFLCLPATASAERPFRLPEQINDRVSALDPTAKGELQSAIDDLYDTHRVRLWVVYVASFEPQDPEAWAAATERASQLSDRDVLLSVATVDQSYYLSSPGLPTDISDSELEDIRVNAIEPALREQDWAGAAIAAAGGLSDAMGATGGGDVVKVLAVGGGVIAVGAGGVVLYSRRKKAQRLEAGTAAARQIDPSDTKALAALPVNALDVRAKEVLVEMDNAVRTSTEELQLAKDEFGDEAARPFTEAFDNANNALAQAFAIRQRLDDDIPETPEQRRDMLVDLISNCGKADRELDAKVTEFDQMRDLLINASSRLDGLTRDIVELTARVPNSDATLTSLVAEFPAPALAPVKDNVTMTKDRLAFADKNVTAAREAIALPAGKQGPAVAAIRAAEAAVAQARTLLDAVDHAAENIRHAIATIGAALADARKDVAAANELLGHGGPELAKTKSAVEAAIGRAEGIKDSNPLGAFNEIATADVELDKALTVALDRKQNAERLQQQVEQAMTAASSQVTAASDFISTRRGAVDAEARTRLSEAQRHLDEAQRLRASDPSNALVYAQSAAELGSRALRAAQSDVSSWENQQSSRGGSNAGAVLGGILIDSMLRGGFSSGSRGGRYSGGGGRGPGSFGGAGSSRRIGGGGRF